MEREGKITEEEAAGALIIIKGIQNDESPAATTPPLQIQIAPATTTQSEIDGYKTYLLGLINHDRTIAGLTQLTSGTNSAAQLHAEEMLEHSYLSHWGLDGSKPYMRFAIAAGISGDFENVSGIEEELAEGVQYREIVSVETELREAQRGFMRSTGHRETILNPWHQQVNLGIACNVFTCAVVQHFEAQYVEYEEIPNIASGVLSVSGRILSPFAFELFDIWYERPPSPLSLGQVDVTSCYGIGDIPVAFVSPPPPPGSFYPEGNSI